MPANRTGRAVLNDSASSWPWRWSNRRPRRDDGASLRQALCIRGAIKAFSHLEDMHRLGSVRLGEPEVNETKFQDSTRSEGPSARAWGTH